MPLEIRCGRHQRRDARRCAATGFVLRGGFEGCGGHECGHDGRGPLRGSSGNGRRRAVYAATDDSNAQTGVWGNRRSAGDPEESPALKKQGALSCARWILAETKNQDLYDASFFSRSFLPVMPTIVSLT